jgi:hypothetical protein
MSMEPKETGKVDDQVNQMIQDPDLIKDILKDLNMNTEDEAVKKFLEEFPNAGQKKEEDKDGKDPSKKMDEEKK